MILELLRERVQEHAPEPEKEPVHKPVVCPACHTEHPYDEIYCTQRSARRAANICA